MSSEGNKIWHLLIDLAGSQHSLKKVKDKYFKAKEIFSGIVPDTSDNEALMRLFRRGSEIVGRFFRDWQEGKIEPTDEELDLLNEAFIEASLFFSSVLSPEDNQPLQEKINENREIVVREIAKRKKTNPDDQRDSGQRFDKDSTLGKPSDYGFVWIIVILLFLVILFVIVIVAYRRRR